MELTFAFASVDIRNITQLRDDAEQTRVMLTARNPKREPRSATHNRFFDEQLGSAVGAIDFVRGSEN